MNIERLQTNNPSAIKHPQKHSTSTVLAAVNPYFLIGSFIGSLVITFVTVWISKKIFKKLIKGESSFYYAYLFSLTLLTVASAFGNANGGSPQWAAAFLSSFPAHLAWLVFDLIKKKRAQKKQTTEHIAE